MKKAWVEAGKIWWQQIPYRFKRMMIIAFLINTVVSGLTTAVLTAAQLRYMEKHLVKLMRAAMGGKDSWTITVNDKEEIRCMTNKQVMAYWKVAPLSVETRVRRYKMYQAWAEDPEHHSQVLAAVFDTAKIDTKYGNTRMAANGDTNENSTPWAKQFAEDVGLLRDVEGYEQWAKDVGTNYLAVFKGEQAAEFTAFDFGYIRALTWSVEIAAQDTMNEGEAEGGDTESDEEKNFECGYECENGDLCEAAFKDERARRMHIRVKHKYMSTVHLLVIANECPFCCSVFKYKAVAARHVQMATNGGICRTDRSCWCPLLVAPSSATCAVCGEFFFKIGWSIGGTFEVTCSNRTRSSWQRAMTKPFRPK